MSVGLLPLNITCTLREQGDPVHTLLKKPSLPAAPSLRWPPRTTVATVGNNAIVRHLWVSESELDGKVPNTKIGVLQVWQKQESSWKLLARASFKLLEWA
jgi:hypothetical protein